MIWVGWRLQRTETLIVGAILAAMAMLLVPTGLQMAHAFHHDGLSACLGAAPASGACSDAVGSFTARFNGVSNISGWLTLLPGLVGVLFAAPFVLDIENGTYRLAWTQSVTRGRWIAVKLGLALGGAMLFSLAMTLLVTWWRTPWVHLQGRMDPAGYDSEGIVVFGYTLFAVGLAVAIGTLWRRAVPALVISYVGYVAGRIFTDTWLRQRLVSPATASWGLDGRPPASLAHAWVLSEQAVAIGPACGPKASLSKFAFPNCPHVVGHAHAVFQPASHFWALQGVETAIYAGIALVLLAVAAWWAHQRVA